ncbi:hypothetical protein HS088_TW15G00456 [Tripterygium wilfordii]|uniref:Transducin/WD40 repeat-like superfamily protein n=1 Tax=Tripterygium wilfordii TaxID=458696 RepID=A0A7J7CLK3_TRIWF|nr:WD repeat-containing protein 44-like [Tripterygium wilfordii]KAF5734957.1 hypothetical protein HS088_TW15G00456 [Tripterygium wilfordii]
MGCRSEEEIDQFFDTREEISSVSDWDSDSTEESASKVGPVHGFGYELWTRKPESVIDRRRRFMGLMGLSLGQNSDEFQFEIDRITETSGAVLRTADSEDGFLSSYSSPHLTEVRDSLVNGALEDSLVYRIKNLDDGKEFVVDELGRDGMPVRLLEVGSNKSLSFEEFQNSFGPSPIVQQLFSREFNEARDLVNAKKKEKRGWLRKLGVAACIVDRQVEAGVMGSHFESTEGGRRMHKVRVHPCKKRSKELSSLYAVQELVAHEGSILTMKFSLDGRYLATGGEDGIVRVWKVIEDQRLDRLDIPDNDPSCMYFTMDQLSKINTVDTGKEKIDKIKRKPSDSTFVVLPSKVFRISENPLHVFHGHSGDVLDISWSKRGFLLSSSVDKTVRLWQVGCDRCLRIFSHNDYVTCVDFNPLDDNYFISGSIDGKVRIWEVLGCRVVDYIDVRDIVTALCYRPDGKGGIVGSMTGKCRFYDIIENQLQLDTEICFSGKKKLPGKKISGFQFSPCDPSKVMAVSADSTVQVIRGTDVICKLKSSGLRTAGNKICATFTSDGKHIISASDDSSVHVWNYSSQDRTHTRAEKIKSCESFLSHNASIAIPWCGIETLSSSNGDTWVNSLENGQQHQNLNWTMDQNIPRSSPDCFSRTRGFLLESLVKGSPTWPEEELNSSKPVVVSPRMGKSECKFLKSARHSLFSSPHMWGLVIVTAGYDGRIRTYHNYGLPVHL